MSTTASILIAMIIAICVLATTVCFLYLQSRIDNIESQNEDLRVKIDEIHQQINQKVVYWPYYQEPITNLEVERFIYPDDPILKDFK